MAEEKKIPELNPQEIDLDDIEVEVLIIARNPKLLQATATFLNRRNWKTTVLGEVSKAIEAIAEHKPDFVLASLNHTSPAILRLPELMGDGYGITCIGYTEILDNVSSARLQRSKFVNKVTGQASGPNVHRVIRRLLADKFGVTEEGTRKAAMPAGPTSNMDGVQIQKSTAGDAGPSSTTVKGEKDVLSTGKYRMTKGNKRTLKDLYRASGADGVGGKNETESGAAFEVLKRSLMGAAGEKAPEAAAKPPDSESIEALEKVTEAAISDICDMQAGELDGVLSNVTRVGVFPVHSRTAPGYLVVASGMEQQESEEFFRATEVALQKSFQSMGLRGEVEPGFALTVPEVDFGAWAAAQAAFTLVLAHRGFEVGVAFFRTDEPLPVVRESRHDGMLSVKIEAIVTDHPVNFKAYLRLEKNDKFFLYLRNGRVLGPEQKSRLAENEVKDLFMKSVDRENIRMFLAAVFLRDTMKKKPAA